MSPFATRIRELRHARGLSQSDVASRLSSGASPTLVSRLERGLRPNLDAVVNLARALDADPHELLKLAAQPLIEERGRVA